MAKKRTRKVHTVTATVQVRSLTRATTSIHLEVYSRGEKIGGVELGRGSLIWFGKNWRQGKRIPWSRFAEMMEELPR